MYSNVPALPPNKNCNIVPYLHAYNFPTVVGDYTNTMKTTFEFNIDLN